MMRKVAFVLLITALFLAMLEGQTWLVLGLAVVLSLGWAEA